MNTKWIDLDRRFTPVLNGDDAADAQTRAPYAAPNVEDWSAILARRCVVILGERGTGKTAELRAQTKRLDLAKKFSFFIPVEDVATAGIAATLDVDCTHRLQSWRASKEPAWFFLDSVDESKLRGHKLASALRNLARDLQQELARVHVVVSSRMSDWRKADEEEVAVLEGYLTRGDSTRQGSRPLARPHVVSVVPLDRGQVAALAAHEGISNPADFMVALQNGNAWAFVERPLDVQWIGRYWQAKKQLGTLSSLLNFNVLERLKEKESRYTTLSLAKARAGAAALALTATLSQNGSFRLPDEDSDVRAVEAIDPREVLPSWTNDEIRDLLGRGLFDEATYGRVRIHHRIAQEFLAAEELSRLRDVGLPQSEFEAVLFRTCYGKRVVPRHLTGVLAWLSGRDGAIRRKAIDVAPEHLIDEGDPAALPAADRGKTLRAYALKFRDRQKVFHRFDYFGLQRFACVELTDTICDLLLSDAEPDHLKSTLLDIVERGRIADAAHAALSLICSPSASAALRVDAARAVCKAGSADQRATVAKLLCEPLGGNRDLACEVLDALFPADVSIDVVLGTIRSLTPPAARQFTGLDGFLCHKLPRRCNASQGALLLEGLAAIVRERTPLAVFAPAAIPQLAWIVELIQEILSFFLSKSAVAGERLRQRRRVSRRDLRRRQPRLRRRLRRELHDDRLPTAVASAVDAVLAAAEDARVAHYLYSSFRRPNARSPVRRQLLWAQVQRTFAKEKRFPQNHWAIRLPYVFDLAITDVSWLKEDCLRRQDVRERLLAFDWLVHLLPRDPSESEPIAVLRQIASSDAALSKRFERSQNRPMPPQEYQLNLLAHRVHDARQVRERGESRVALAAQLEAIRAGTNFNALVHLYSIGEHARQHCQYGGFEEDKVAKVYDSEIASAGREGMQRFWRDNAPILKHEHQEPNSTPFVCIIGLAGIAQDVRAGVRISGLEEPEIRRALGYGMWEINGFPEWVDEVAAVHPSLLSDVFEPTLRLDYDRPEEGESEKTGMLLWRLVHASTPIQRACAPELVALLREADPPRSSVLFDALNVVQAGVLDKSEITDLARQRLMTSALGAEHIAAWWCTWVMNSPASAVTWLEDGIVPAPNSPTVIEHICDRLWALHDVKPPRRLPLADSIDALSRIIPIVFAVVRPENDLVHHGTYSPTRRDHAQRLRDALLGWLSENEDESVMAVLDRLSVDARLLRERDWIRHLAEVRATSHQLCAPMVVEDAIRFVNDLIREPQTMAELHEIALNRLEDIIHHVSTDDFSVRQVYNPGAAPILEEPVQMFLAKELEDKSRTQYAVVREAEVDRRKKPDIRLVSNHCRGPITIEVKIAQRWTLKELEDALEQQLVALYMKTNKSAYGILMVASSGPGPVCKNSSISATLAEVIDHLRHHAEGVKARNVGVLELAVLAVDFH